MKFKNNNEGVSPVIGVILMVAITVVLAAVVFVLVNDLSSHPNDFHTVGIKQNEDHSFTITSIDETLKYSDLAVKDHGIGQSYTVNSLSPSVSQVLKAGDKIVVSGLTSGSHDVTFVIDNVVIYEKTFTI